MLDSVRIDLKETYTFPFLLFFLLIAWILKAIDFVVGFVVARQVIDFFSRNCFIAGDKCFTCVTGVIIEALFLELEVDGVISGFIFGKMDDTRNTLGENGQ